MLLQAMRETGEEMKRRRQTLKQVTARHAAEEASGGGRRGYGGGYTLGHRPGLVRWVHSWVFFGALSARVIVSPGCLHAASKHIPIFRSCAVIDAH